MKNVQPLVRAHCAAHNARLAWTPKESSSELHSLLSRTRQVLRDVCPVTSATWSASPKAKTLLAWLTHIETPKQLLDVVASGDGRGASAKLQHNR